MHQQSLLKSYCVKKLAEEEAGDPLIIGQLPVFQNAPKSFFQVYFERVTFANLKLDNESLPSQCVGECHDLVDIFIINILS